MTRWRGPPAEMANYPAEINTLESEYCALYKPESQRRLAPGQFLHYNPWPAHIVRQVGSVDLCYLCKAGIENGDAIHVILLGLKCQVKRVGKGCKRVVDVLLQAGLAGNAPTCQHLALGACWPLPLDKTGTTHQALLHVIDNLRLFSTVCQRT